MHVAIFRLDGDEKRLLVWARNISYGITSITFVYGFKLSLSYRQGADIVPGTKVVSCAREQCQELLIIRCVNL
jgi:hypothetical protein